MQRSKSTLAVSLMPTHQRFDIQLVVCRARRWHLAFGILHFGSF
jgi:hypothetical protein